MADAPGEGSARPSEGSTRAGQPSRSPSSAGPSAYSRPEPPPRRHIAQLSTPTAFIPQPPHHEHAVTDTDRHPAQPHVQLPPMPPPPPTPSRNGPGSLTPSGIMQGAGPVSSSRPQPMSQPHPMAPPQGPPQSMSMMQAMQYQPQHAQPLPPHHQPMMTPHQAMAMQPPAVALRGNQPREMRTAASHVQRSRAYAFVLDAQGLPIELGSGRFAKAYLGEERWLESKTDYRRDVVIKILQRGVDADDHMRFQMEKELLERVQGHPNIVELMASGENEDIEFIPPSIRDKVESEFMILERLEMSLEERLKGSRSRGKKDDLLAIDMRERIFHVLDYIIPVASAVEYAHLVRNICHRDIKPANILIQLPDPNLRGSTLEVRLADFNVAKLRDEDVNFAMTQMKSVPGTLFFQSPEQETNVIELLVNVVQGVPEVEYFEDFYIQIAKNDTFALYNRGENYPILYADRARKKLVLGRPYRDVSEANVRAKIQKSVGRPADIYSLGALLYYLISGAYANPKTLYDAFHKFIEYERADENNTIDGYLEHEYSVINSLRAPKQAENGIEVAPADRFFSYKHYLDGNGELIDPHVMKLIARCMIRNKPDSYCLAHDVETRGSSDFMQDLIDLYAVYGVHPAARPTNLARRGHAGENRGALMRSFDRVGSRLRWLWMIVFRRKK